MIVVIRHGQTDASEKYLASGPRSRGIGLNAAGIASAREAMEHLQNLPLDLIVSSNYGRTAQSASILADRHGSVVRRVDKELDELDYGDFDGEPWLAYGSWLTENGPNRIPPGGKASWNMCLARSIRAMILHAESSSCGVIVCHGYQWSAIHEFVKKRSLPCAETLENAPYCRALITSKTELLGMIEALDEPQVGSAGPAIANPGTAITNILEAMGFTATADNGQKGAVFSYSGRPFVNLQGSTVRFMQDVADNSHPELTKRSGAIELSLINPHNTAFVTIEAASFMEGGT